jgi:hypothetical protein
MKGFLMNTTATEVESTEPVTYEKGSWQESLQKSSNLLDRSAKARKTASSLLWKGAQAGIEAWLPGAQTDVSGENLYAEVIEALGRARKGDASKIRTVAVAVRNNGLDLSTFPNLSKAYAEAVRLTRTVKQQEDEDDAAEEAIAGIEAPKTASTQESAAALLLAKGLDGAVVAILDALGAKNEAAHRAFLRAVSTEIAARVKATADAEAQAKKDEAAKKKAEAAAAAPKKTAAKKSTPAPVAAKGKPKGKPATKTAAAKATAPINDGVEDGTDEDVEVDESVEVVETPSVPVAKKASAKGRPVVRRPGR